MFILVLKSVVLKLGGGGENVPLWMKPETTVDARLLWMHASSLKWKINAIYYIQCYIYKHIDQPAVIQYSQYHWPNNFILREKG